MRLPLAPDAALPVKTDRSPVVVEPAPLPSWTDPLSPRELEPEVKSNEPLAPPTV